MGLRAEAFDEFTGVPENQRELKRQGVELTREADDSTTGPRSCVPVEPDGNPFLIDRRL